MTRRVLMDHYGFTKQKLVSQRRDAARRVAIVIGGAVASAALGLFWVDSGTAFGAVRFAFLGGTGALVALVLTK